MQTKYCKLRGSSTFQWWGKSLVSMHFVLFRVLEPYLNPHFSIITFVVAMLERNLMRLFYNFHHPDRQLKDRNKAALEAQRPAPWYGNPVQIYIALVATAIFSIMFAQAVKK